MYSNQVTSDDRATSSQLKKEEKSNLTTILVATLVPVGVVMLVAAGVFIWCKRKQGSGIPSHLSHIQRAFGSRDYGSSSNALKIRHQKMENEHDTFELKVANIVNESDIED